MVKKCNKHSMHLGLLWKVTDYLNKITEWTPHHSRLSWLPGYKSMIQKHSPSLDFFYVNTHLIPLTGSWHLDIDHRCSTHRITHICTWIYTPMLRIYVNDVTHRLPHSELHLYWIYYLDIGHWDCQHHFRPRLHLTPPPCHNFSFFLQ